MPKAKPTIPQIIDERARRAAIVAVSGASDASTTTEVAIKRAAVSWCPSNAKPDVMLRMAAMVLIWQLLYLHTSHRLLRAVREIRFPAGCSGLRLTVSVRSTAVLCSTSLRLANSVPRAFDYLFSRDLRYHDRALFSRGSGWL